MKRVIAALLLAVCMMALAVSCTREPTKLERDGTTCESVTTVPDAGGINNGGANTEGDWGKLYPVG